MAFEVVYDEREFTEYAAATGEARREMTRRIAERWYPLARQIAADEAKSRYQKKFKLDEAYGCAALGLMKAVDRFKPGAGKFPRYLEAYVRGEMLAGSYQRDFTRISRDFTRSRRKRHGEVLRDADMEARDERGNRISFLENEASARGEESPVYDGRVVDARVARIINLLGPFQAQVARLVAIEGVTCGDAAIRLGVDERRVRQGMSRAIKKIQKIAGNQVLASMSQVGRGDKKQPTIQAVKEAA